MLWKNGLIDARDTTCTMSFPLSTPMLPNCFLNYDTTLWQNAFYRTFYYKYKHKKHQNHAPPHFHIVKNKGLIHEEINNCFQDKLYRTDNCVACQIITCTRVYCLNCIWNKSEVTMKTTSLWLVCNNAISFTGRKYIIKYFSPRYQLSNIIIRGISFKTKRTPPVDTRGLTECAQLEISSE